LAFVASVMVFYDAKERYVRTILQNRKIEAGGIARVPALA
jgi:hypothetical protein